MRMFKGKEKKNETLGFIWRQCLQIERMNHSHRHLESQKKWQAWKQMHKWI